LLWLQAQSPAQDFVDSGGDSRIKLAGAFERIVGLFTKAAHDGGGRDSTGQKRIDGGGQTIEIGLQTGALAILFEGSVARRTAA
jgi:hypothetical protein